MSAGDYIGSDSRMWDDISRLATLLEPFISEDQMINFDDYFMGLILS